MPPATHPLVAIEDDPTGTQLLERAWVCADPTPATLATAGQGPRSLHLLTNSRALSPERAYAVVFAALRATADALPGAPVVLRGDSTLRAHLEEEYRALCDALHDGAPVPLLLAPALPSAGRITLDGVHWLVRGSERVPLAETEYARDPALGYRHSRLGEWAEERSGGRLAAAAEVPLAAVRGRQGSAAIVAAVREVAAGGRPGVVVPDAVEPGDLAVIAAAIEECRREGVPLAVRCAPALVGALAGNLAHDRARAPRGCARVLVLAGSFVPLTTRQLGLLEAAHPGSVVVADAVTLGGDAAAAAVEVERLRAAAEERLRAGGIAVVATPREPDRALDGEARERLAHRLAAVVGAVPADAVVAKGGVTSAVTFVEGLGATRADVVGPVVPGVSLWRPLDGPRRGSAYLVVPGNVGDDRLLVDVVDAILNHRRSTNA